MPLFVEGEVEEEQQGSCFAVDSVGRHREEGDPPSPTTWTSAPLKAQKGVFCWGANKREKKREESSSKRGEEKRNEFIAAKGG